MTGHRLERLAEELREEVARIVARELKDPRLGFVTVTRVELSADQRHARVLVGVMGEDAARRASLQALERAAGFVRRELGRRVRLRHTPELQFRLDKGLDASDRVARLLDEVRRSGEGGPEPGSGDGEDGA